MARILVAEDEPDIRNLSTHNLAAEHEVAAASDGAAALALVTEGFVPEIAVLDVGMPEMTGFQLIRELRALPNVDTDLPCIFLTALVGGETADQTALLNSFYLPKPYHADQLRLTVSMAMLNRSADFS